MAEPRFDRLVALLPSLASRAGGVGDRLYTLVHEDGVILAGDWTDAPGELAVKTADLDSCRRLLTALVRRERFVEGSLDEAIEAGLVGRVVRRIAELDREARGMIDVATDILADEENDGG